MMKFKLDGRKVCWNKENLSSYRVKATTLMYIFETVAGGVILIDAETCPTKAFGSRPGLEW